MKKSYSITLFILLTSCGLRFEPKQEIVSPELQKVAFWNKRPEAFNLDSLLQHSKEQNKPVLLYFTGYGCVNNRKMEDKIFVYKDIYDLMHNQFIPLALYVDDRQTKLQEPDTSADGRIIKTIGDQNSELQRTMFGRNSQPHIVALGSDGSMISEIAYTQSRVEFKDFLTKALANL